MNSLAKKIAVIDNKQAAHQERLAFQDIDLLQASVKNLKDRQFQILMIGITVINGLLGTTAGFVFPDGITEDSHLWVILLPFVCVLFSFSMLAIFLQKNASIRRQDIFTLLLQRYISTDSLPPNYRGWVDAYANYNHFLRYGGVNVYYENTNEFPSHFKNSLLAPADAFSLLTSTVFLLTPMVAISLMFFMAISLGIDTGSYTILVAITVTLATLAYAQIFKEFKAINRGKRSFRYLTVLFDKILKHAPEWDPKNNGKLTVATSSLKKNTREV